MALALTALSEIGNQDMCKALAPEVQKLICSGNIYTKKKAALAATRIIRKEPELAQSFAEILKFLLKERNHGVFLAALGLMEEILKVKPKFKSKFKKHLEIMIKV